MSPGDISARIGVWGGEIVSFFSGVRYFFSVKGQVVNISDSEAYIGSFLIAVCCFTTL